MLSIIVVSWKNFDLLKITIESIMKNSYYENEILVFLQEACIKSESYLIEKGILYEKSLDNIGLSKAANILSQKANKDYLCFIDDDMYVIPNWDKELLDFKIKYNINGSVCSVMIENDSSNNINCGYCLSTFNESCVLEKTKKLVAIGKYNNSSCPFIVNKSDYFLFGGYDEDFPVIGAELGLSKRMWDFGFYDIGIEVPTSFVYHFKCSSTSRMVDRQRQAEIREHKFNDKYKLTADEFRKIMKKGEVHQWQIKK